MKPSEPAPESKGSGTKTGKPAEPVTAPPEKTVPPPGRKEEPEEPAGVLEESEMIDAWLDKVKDMSMPLFQHLARAEEFELAGEELKTVNAWFRHDDSFHANQVSRRKADLQELFTRTCGITPRIVIKTREAEEKEEDSNPVDDPRVQTFLKRYPGKITVRKKNNNRH